MSKKQHTTLVAKKLFAIPELVEEVQERMTLRQMQDFVGGYIEMCPCTVRGHSLIVNENGGYTDLAFNDAATELVLPGTLLLPGGLRGNALLVKTRTL